LLLSNPRQELQKIKAKPSLVFSQVPLIFGVWFDEDFVAGSADGCTVSRSQNQVWLKA
jgi:hypothetical protein